MAHQALPMRVATVALLTTSTLVAVPSGADAAPTTPTLAAAPTAVTAPATSAAGSAAKVVEKRSAFVASAPTSARLRAGLRAAAAPAARTAATAPMTAVMPATGDVTVLGASWKRGTGPQTHVEYRTKTKGVWGSWAQAQHGDCPACTSEEEHGPTSREGSAAISVVGVQAVQARLVTPSGTAPQDARFSVIDPGDATSDGAAAAAGGAPGDAPLATAAGAIGGGRAAASPAAGRAAAAASGRWVRSRASWGAKRTRVNGRFRPVAVAVHHTDGTNNYSRAQVPSILRGIQAFHRFDRGWNDIGYNALVDKFGRVWEGRNGGLDRPSVGAHATGFNDRVAGISVLGDFNKRTPPTAVVRSVSWAAARVGHNFGFNPRSKVWMKGRKYSRIVGHRNIGQTTCPGTYLYAKLPTIRKLTASY